jgi:hypothetical protein
MAQDKNFIARAFAAVIAGRQRQAQRYVDRFERVYSRQAGKFTEK